MGNCRGGKTLLSSRQNQKENKEFDNWRERSNKVMKEKIEIDRKKRQK